ncbi:hypothetical protein NIES4072_31170 [Nostoc commune NIES-4072]|uniref:Uncharacterized protein n=1 Tax=Nostoc commune NIES-4072 TaxID=2005467 RepID=A0A2R5FN36_NOSCO|nr:hypothetical protein NIES4070_59590 [Nostoc commune HK-02]GBG19449.1 hypothetical protein NIES4072_31170 [Nostoc commune NIES-4072]
MKAITVKGPIAWTIFNANYTTLLGRIMERK